MRILIFGSGAVGGYFGTKLLLAGNDVRFIAKGEHLRLMKTKGMRIITPQGEFTTPPLKASENIMDLGIVDLVLVGVKAWQVKEAALAIKQVEHANMTVLPLQNGIYSPMELAQALDPSHIIGGFCKIFSKLESPGIIRHMSHKPTIMFGELDNIRRDRISRIQETFEKAGIEARVCNDIQSGMWQKFMSICSGAVTALNRITYGQVFESETHTKLLRNLLTEIHELAKLEGINLKPDIVDRTFRFLQNLPYDTTSSMQRDIMEKRPSELEYQNGTVVKLGIKHHFPTPVNQMLYECLLPMERRARKAES